MAIRDLGKRQAVMAAWEDTFLVCLGKIAPDEVKRVKDWPTISRMGSQGYTAIQAAEKYLADITAQRAAESTTNITKE